MTPALDRTSATASQKSDYLRLHITPLDPELLKVVISASILPRVRSISYHTIETFPENRYGFVELPREEAENLRRKLNGATLKGVKIRIEPAKPLPVLKIPFDEETLMASGMELDGKSGTKGKKSYKDRDGSSQTSKRDGEKLIGVELKDGRKVKRGWTVSPAEQEAADRAKKKTRKKKQRSSGKDKRRTEEKDKRKKSKEVRSKYTDHSECLIKTLLPPNAVIASVGSAKKGKKSQSSREVVMHEFEKTTKFPTFLRSTVLSGESKPAAEFVEGKGWMDAECNLLEAVSSRPLKHIELQTPESTKAKVQDNASISSSVSSSEDDTTDETPPKPAKIAQEHGADFQEAINNEIKLKADEGDTSAGFAELSKSSGSARSLSIEIPHSVLVSPGVHPLEALYKRRKQAEGTSLETNQEPRSFSFFGNSGSDQDDDKQSKRDSTPTTQRYQPPTTPSYSRHDLEERTIRGAASTPDTAHPARRFHPRALTEDDVDLAEVDGEEDEDDNIETDAGGVVLAVDAQKAIGEEKLQSDFEKYFWEHRGDLSRAWKKRRKTAGKEKRWRENKARSQRIL